MHDGVDDTCLPPLAQGSPRGPSPSKPKLASQPRRRRMFSNSPMVKEDTWTRNVPGADPIGQMVTDRYCKIYTTWGWTGNVKSATWGWTCNVKSAIRGWTGNAIRVWTGNVKSAIRGWTGNVKSAIRGWTGNVDR